MLLQCPKYETNRNQLKKELQDLGIQQITTAILLGAADTDEATKVKITEILGDFIERSLRYKDL